MAELRPRIDLREEIALMGEDVRSAVDARGLAKWGTAPAVPFFPGARIVAPILAVVAVATLAGFFAHRITGLPFLAALLAEMDVWLLRSCLGRGSFGGGNRAGARFEAPVLVVGQLGARGIFIVTTIGVGGPAARRGDYRIAAHQAIVPFVGAVGFGAERVLSSVRGTDRLEAAVRDGRRGVAAQEWTIHWAMDRGGWRV